MNPNIVLLHIAERRLYHWQERMQAAFRTANDKEASICQLLIREYLLLLDEAFAQIRSQAASFVGIESDRSATDASVRRLGVPEE